MFIDVYGMFVALVHEGMKTTLKKKQFMFHPAQEKQQLLQQFVQHGENMKAIEMQLQVTKEQEGETTFKRELLTIKEMRNKGFSQRLISKGDQTFL